MTATENLAPATELSLDVGIGEDGPYPAVVDLYPAVRDDPASAYAARWNGWVAEPRFDRATVDAIRAAFDATRADPAAADCSWLEWSGTDGHGSDTLTVHDPVAEADYGGHTYCTSEAPDSDGRYAIGAYGWCWYEWDGSL